MTEPRPHTPYDPAHDCVDHGAPHNGTREGCRMCAAFAIAGPAWRQQGEDADDVTYQVDGLGPGIQFERWERAGETGWYVYSNPDKEEPDDGPLTEEEALDWLWRHPPHGELS